MVSPYEQYIASAPKECHVCGAGFTEAKQSITKEFTGEYYSFCSAECLAAFERDPEQYTRNGDDEAD